MTEKIEEQSRRVTESVVEKVTAFTKTPTTRRTFLKLGLSGAGAAGLYLAGCSPAQVAKPSPSTKPREVYVANATGMVVGAPNLCVGCRRCEIACTNFNEGKTDPTLARIKINRNYNFGPSGAGLAFWRGEGTFGNHLIIQDTCKQCRHPVPCQLACPHDAIEVVPPANARVINTSKCVGCRTCQAACPWGMTTFDEVAKKASKCHLCSGNPECVKACPTGALQYVPWQERTTPPRFVVPANIQSPDDVKDTCVECH